MRSLAIIEIFSTESVSIIGKKGLCIIGYNKFGYLCNIQVGALWSGVETCLEDSGAGSGHTLCFSRITTVSLALLKEANLALFLKRNSYE
jgi:hypothetical protein